MINLSTLNKFYIEDFKGKSPFLLKPISYIKYASDSYSLYDDLIWWNGNCLIRIPKMFYWDGASVPFIFSWYEKRDSNIAASCIHDWCYRHHYIMVYNFEKCVFEWDDCSKYFADMQWFLCLHYYYKVKYCKDRILTWAVRLFGGYSWKAHYCKFDCNNCNVFCTPEVQCTLYRQKIVVKSEVDMYNQYYESIKR